MITNHQGNIENIYINNSSNNKIIQLGCTRDILILISEVISPPPKISIYPCAAHRSFCTRPVTYGGCSTRELQEFYSLNAVVNSMSWRSLYPLKPADNFTLATNLYQSITLYNFEYYIFTKLWIPGKEVILQATQDTSQKLTTLSDLPVYHTGI